MATNIGGITLGNLILGKALTSVNNLTVSQTITFSQAISHNFQALTQTLTFSQTIGLQPVWGREVDQTITFTQDIKDVQPEAISQSLTFSESISYDKEKIQSLSQSLTLTQDIEDSHIATPIVVQGLFPIQTIAYNGVFNLTVNPPLTFTQTILGDYCKVISENLTFSQTITYTKSKVITQELEFGSSFVYNTSFTRPINTLFIPFQNIGLIKQQSITVNQSLNLNQTIIGADVKFVTHTLNLTQSIVGTNSKFAGNTLNFSQTLNQNHTTNGPVDSLLNLSQNIVLNRSLSFKIHHGFGMNSFVKHWKVFYPSVPQTLNFDSEICFTRYTEPISQSLSLAQTISYVHPINQSVDNLLNLNSLINPNGAFNQSVTSVLTFSTSRPVYLGMVDCQTINIDNLQYALIPHNPGGAYRTKNRPHCVLQTYNTVVVVPTPDWNDTENYDGIFTIRRSMNGIPYTYVRVLELRKLRLPFTLDAAKADELKAFLLDADTKLITLTTWKGDKWIVHLTSNPLEFVRRGRYMNDFEKAEVTVEFEGYKVM